MSFLKEQGLLHITPKTIWQKHQDHRSGSVTQGHLGLMEGLNVTFILVKSEWPYPDKLVYFPIYCWHRSYRCLSVSEWIQFYRSHYLYHLSCHLLLDIHFGNFLWNALQYKYWLQLNKKIFEIDHPLFTTIFICISMSYKLFIVIYFKFIYSYSMVIYFSKVVEQF